MHQGRNDRGAAWGSDTSQGGALNNHILPVRNIVREAIASPLGELIVGMLEQSREGTSEPKLLFYRGSIESERSFLVPLILEAYARMEIESPHLNMLTVPDTWVPPSSPQSYAEQVAKVDEARAAAVSMSNKLLAGSAGADVLFFDTTLGAGGSNETCREIDAALSLIRPGGYLIYLQDSGCTGYLSAQLERESILEQGAAREEILKQLKDSVVRCLTVAESHLSPKVESLDWGELLSTEEIDTATLRERLAAYPRISAIEGDLSAFNYLSCFGCNSKVEDSAPAGKSLVSFQAFTLFAKKKS